MATSLATPGVYIEEKSAFPSSVAGIPTAIPAFIGYTEKVVRNGQSLINKPVRISSLAEYHATFGGAFRNTFSIKPATGDQFDFEVDGTTYQLASDNESPFIFYNSIRLFFANGGSTCYIVSSGAYYTNETVANKPAAA
ncbi:MAG: phage tail sheath family protein, partial [Cyclobacteriaceae bacterium]